MIHLGPTTRRGRLRFIVLLAVVLVPTLAYQIWSPGEIITDGRHDFKTNGIWLAHGWLGDEAWFIDNDREHQRDAYRGPVHIAAAVARWRAHHITDLFPHLAPASPGGALPGADAAQVERLLNACDGMRVMPWIGGVRDAHCFPQNPRWRARFVESVRDLLDAHPRLAGVHLNVEPWPSGDVDMLTLLEELRAAMPPDKLLSIAAYPPPTRWHPYPQVHWDEAYFRQVAARCDHLAVMMYDTSIRLQKPYRKLMCDWTRQVIEWSEGTPVLLGLPAYEDQDVDYHHPRVENLDNALRGIHAGIASFGSPPANYRGVAIYSDWTTDAHEWATLRERFLAVTDE